ncbi:MAG TPA: hypothetical protein VIL85_11845 [Thermomicrobiales bacterium]|jgi:hypothetical protein
MNEAYERLREARQRNADQRYQSQAQPYPARVSTLVKESGTGIVTGIRATLTEGGAEVELAVPRGTGVREGSSVTLIGDKNDPTAPLRFGQIDYDDDPSAGNTDDADLTVPEWADPAHLSRLLGPGRANLTVYWHAIEGKGASGYQVSMRRYGTLPQRIGELQSRAGALSPGEATELTNLLVLAAALGAEAESTFVASGWAEPAGIVAHLGGIQQTSLGENFPPGLKVDVQIRAFYPWAGGGTGAFSVPGELKTFVLAVDDVSPGSAIGLNVSTATPGTLIMEAVQGGDLNPPYFRGWVYELATSSGGPTTQTSAPLTGAWTPLDLEAGDYYGAVYPVSNSGVPGGRYPAIGYDGPHAVTGAYTPDLDPPPQWATPILTIERVQSAEGGEQAWLTVTLPGGYAYPDDYRQTRVHITNGSVSIERTIGRDNMSLTDVVPFGTSAVTIQGEDKAGNLSDASPEASITLAPTGAPSGLTLTTESASEAVICHVTMPTGALRVEIYRATASDGAGEALVAEIDGTFFVDMRQGIAAGTIYYYRARARNKQG